MEALWNKIKLERPPNVTWRANKENFDTKHFSVIINNALIDLKSQDALHTEAAILSRMIYRMKRKFRNDKGLKYMEEVNRALLNYLTLSLEKEYENLKSYIEKDGIVYILPSRQMVEYVLVRTQGFAKLMVRVEEVAQHAAKFLKERIECGHAWIISVVAYAVICRIWILSRNLVKRSAIWYNEIRQHVQKFKSIGAPWLPINYKLPNDLSTWMGLSWINEDITNIPSNKDLKNTMFRLLQPVPETMECITESTEKARISESTFSESEAVETNNVLKVKSLNTNGTDDIGVHIDRDIYLTSNSKKELDTMTVTKKRKTEQQGKCIEKATKRKKMSALTKTDLNNRKNDKTNTTEQVKGAKQKTETSFSVDTTQDSSAKVQSTKDLVTAIIRTELDLVEFLNKDSHPGLDKLQWYIIQKKGWKLLNKLVKVNDKNHHAILKKIIQTVKGWIK